jgi:hypothetical protein
MQERREQMAIEANRIANAMLDVYYAEMRKPENMGDPGEQLELSLNMTAILVHKTLIILAGYCELNGIPNADYKLIKKALYEIIAGVREENKQKFKKFNINKMDQDSLAGSCELNGIPNADYKLIKRALYEIIAGVKEENK